MAPICLWAIAPPQDDEHDEQEKREGGGYENEPAGCLHRCFK